MHFPLSLTCCARRLEHVTSFGAVTGCEESVGLERADGPKESGDKLSSCGDSETGLWSIVIPTYNRLPILTKCLRALEHQVDATEHGIKVYKVVVVDDGSDDGTVEFLQTREGEFQHVRLLQQKHAGAAAARNMGVADARGEVIVFIDSDLVVTVNFLQSHAKMLRSARNEDGDDRSFTYGRVVNTSNFDYPESEPFKISDFSAAFFTSGNVAISRRRLLDASDALPTSTTAVVALMTPLSVSTDGKT
ncbi:hypothetical protein CBR_g54340 [Chara braunii]|uniref:Glycosyltransferase 2-like domain-containing protein n=1 Tax=Chara braunii TaxID=69332 RepID=A0A388MC53_CHABU|nr:hypothetical protein CBR_g54340 [Chara braunii]|eukprot:GBG92085.1 hypothetical protein CBR_g54340 [Chara braunii]